MNQLDFLNLSATSCSVEILAIVFHHITPARRYGGIKAEQELLHWSVSVCNLTDFFFYKGGNFMAEESSGGFLRGGEEEDLHWRIGITFLRQSMNIVNSSSNLKTEEIVLPL